MTMTDREFAAQPAGPPFGQLHKALELMEQALALLDDHAGPCDAGAHLDLAVHRLREWIEVEAS